MSNLRKTLEMCVFLAFAIAWVCCPVWGQCVPSAKLLPSDGAPVDWFGRSVAISGDTAIIGARYDDDNGDLSGSAYIFRYNGSSWVEEQKLLASDGADSDAFGYSVAISGGTALIGACGNDDNGSASGSAYIFRYNGSSWVEEQKLLASDGADSDAFGFSVAISGGTALIGAHLDDDNANASGSAYIFRYNGSSWVEEAKLVASDGEWLDQFGMSVAIFGGTAIVGKEYDDDNGHISGSAYVFRYNGLNWVEEAKLLASDGADADQFGSSVAISGGIALIGALYDDDNGSASGSAYVFRYDGSNWVEEQKLVASDGARWDNFGCSVAISEGTALIGAILGHDDNGSKPGSAYVFRYNGSSWVEEAKLLSYDGAEDDYFGSSVAISGGTALIGADGDDDNGMSSGSTYVFALVDQTGDFDDGCDVDFDDFAIFGLAWKTEPGDAQWNTDCDISYPKDNVIDWLDLSVFADNWLAGIGRPIQ